MKTINKGKVVRQVSSRNDLHKWHRAAGLVMPFVLLAVIFFNGCEGHENDPTAPEGSVITVSATPQTIVIPMGVSSGATLITATLRSENGARLPGQEITFRTSAGILDPQGQTPLRTDDQGVATSVLTTSSGATVTATSGNITAETSVQTASGDISAILLSVTPQQLFTCSDVLDLQATVIATDGSPVASVVLNFFTVQPYSTVSGTFSPSTNIVTDVSGLANVTWTPSLSICQDECSQQIGMGSGDCFLKFQVEDISGTFTSVEVEVDDNVN